jgi:hypothetical protein
MYCFGDRQRGGTLQTETQGLGPTVSHLTPIEVIANYLAVGHATVERDLASAIKKLKEDGPSRAALYELIHARLLSQRLEAMREGAGPRCISAECNPEWITKWSPGDDEGETRRSKRRKSNERGRGNLGGFIRRTNG